MNKPMPIKDIPEYLTKTREHNESITPVVDMGQIMVEPENKKKPWQNMTFAVLLSFLLCLGVVFYDAVTIDRFTVTVDNITPSEQLSQAVSDSGGYVTGVRKIGENTYEINISTRKNKQSFLDQLGAKINIRNYTD